MSDNVVPDIFLSANRFGIRLGLERMTELAGILGNPQEGLSCYHVAGTNGKGSVVSFIAASLAASGKKVGVYTSPYLERFSERIRILDGREGLVRYRTNDAYGEISATALEKIGDRISKAVGQMIESGSEHPTEFELVTAAAFIYFREHKCDCVVLETGLGGRLDSTNIISRPICSIITALGYDHMDRLGSSIEEIATEKAGIIKSGCPVFFMSPYDTTLSPDDAREAEAVISEICARRGSGLTIVSQTDILERIPSEAGQELRFRFMAESRVHIRFIGRHQALNAALAARAMVVHGLSGEQVAEGLSEAVWKGRNEIISSEPTIILDGAHNPQGMESFCAAVNESFGRRFTENPPRLIMGVMSDKDYDLMIRVMLRTVSFPFREVICVTVRQERSLSAERLAEAFREAAKSENKFYNRIPSMYNVQGKILISEDANAAFRDAVSRSRDDGAPLLCVGSLYLVGQVRSVFRKPGGDGLNGLD